MVLSELMNQMSLFYICLFKLLCELSIFKSIENIIFVMDLEMDTEHTPSISIVFVFYLYLCLSEEFLVF